MTDIRTGRVQRCRPSDAGRTAMETGRQAMRWGSHTQGGVGGTPGPPVSVLTVLSATEPRRVRPPDWLPPYRGAPVWAEEGGSSWGRWGKLTLRLTDSPINQCGQGGLMRLVISLIPRGEKKIKRSSGGGNSFFSYPTIKGVSDWETMAFTRH